MYSKLVLTAAALIVTASLAPAAHSETPAAGGILMTYEVFENTVPHADLEVCPEEFTGQAVFCRLTAAHDNLNVIVFSEEGDQPMVAVRQVDLTSTTLVFK